jgi:hypothetical protein
MKEENQALSDAPTDELNPSSKAGLRTVRLGLTFTKILQTPRSSSFDSRPCDIGGGSLFLLTAWAQLNSTDSDLTNEMKYIQYPHYNATM